MSRKTFWQRAEQLPPCLVRLLARHPHGKPLTDKEISHRMGWENVICAVRFLAEKTDWEGITLDSMRLFLQACNVDFENVVQMKRVDSYLRSKPSFTYLRKSPEWSTKWAPMLQRWRDSLPR